MTGEPRSSVAAPSPDQLRGAVEHAVTRRSAQVTEAALRLSDAAQSLATAAKDLLSLVEPRGNGEHDAAIMTAVARWRPLPPRPLRAFNRHDDAASAANSWETAVHRWEIALQLFRWEAEFTATLGEK